MAATMLHFCSTQDHIYYSFIGNNWQRVRCCSEPIIIFVVCSHVTLFVSIYYLQVVADAPMPSGPVVLMAIAAARHT